ncbi:Septin-domain-containing protein [Yarrowia lipolytica]|nr:hypothetical protein YALI1_C06259g [Yarrowia lipolytica]KAB8283181.1 Septin-domain-containing protein [Yarrowia lipolytica]KAE8173900.1 Septin-domain-containing protein [Yarrowia lipolytica]QNP97455.1 Septin spn3 [Yarrowia lipolytica]RDW26389.1 Septin-domain-containing protein [Yarrowia lipolytica]
MDLPSPNAPFRGMQRVASSSLLRHKKVLKKGTKFSLLVCGPGGSGRATFVNALIDSQLGESGDKVKQLIHRTEVAPEEAHIEPGITLEPWTETLYDEEGGALSITFVDTPGFGDNINNEVVFPELLGFIERQYDNVLAEENRIRRNPKFRDDRVHVLLYFIEATGHGLRELDVELMRQMSTRANVIPILAKADTLTPSELAENKRLIMEDIEYHQIPIYNFPYDPEEDDETIEQNSHLRSLLPFAVIGSNEVAVVNGKRCLVRTYPWGSVDIEDPRFSDFAVLRNVLLGSHLEDLKEATHSILYENYRTKKLSTNDSPLIDQSATPDMSEESFVAREERLRAEEARFKEIEEKVQREIAQKKRELLERERELREIEARLKNELVVEE